MKNQEIMVVYKWTAKNGKLEELKGIYEKVTAEMKNNEPGAIQVDCFLDDFGSTLVVVGLFSDANAVGFHLTTTAAGHFEDLLQIATLCEFIFFGDIPNQMKQAAVQMGLKATFVKRAFGFERATSPQAS